MLARSAIYLDSNAGAPLRPSVVKALLLLFQDALPLLPNASSIHLHGRKAKRLLAESREQVAYSLGPKTDSEQLILTSSGTEANQLAIRGILEQKLLNGEKPHLITTTVEHDSVLSMAKWLEARGGSVSYLPVDADGRLCIDLLDSLWKPETAMVSAVWVNNETGVITDVQALARAVRAKRGTLHLDAAQAWGKLKIDVAELGAQLVTVSAHKIGGLAGAGALWLERGTHIKQSVIQGKQEKGRRGGTENLLGCIAMGAAAAALDPVGWSERVAPLRDRLQSVITQRIPGTLVNGGEAPRVANTLNLNFQGVKGDGLVMALDLAGYSVSAGSACASGVMEPSHVLMAMGKSREHAMAAIRVSLSDAVAWETLDAFVTALEKVVERFTDKVDSFKESELDRDRT